MVDDGPARQKRTGKVSATMRSSMLIRRLIDERAVADVTAVPA
jgi:hypothetical protein